MAYTLGVEFLNLEYITDNTGADVIGYDSALGELISDYVRLTDSGDGNPLNGVGSVTLEIDVDGALNGSSFQSYVVFNDQGVDLATMIANGNLFVE